MLPPFVVCAVSVAGLLAVASVLSFKVTGGLIEAAAGVLVLAELPVCWEGEA